jgi:hypothetical protein
MDVTPTMKMLNIRVIPLQVENLSKYQTMDAINPYPMDGTEHTISMRSRGKSEDQNDV